MLCFNYFHFGKFQNGCDGLKAFTFILICDGLTNFTCIWMCDVLESQWNDSSAGITNLDALYIIMWSYYDQWFTYKTNAYSYISICYHVVILWPIVHWYNWHSFIYLWFSYKFTFCKYAELCVCMTH